MVRGIVLARVLLPIEFGIFGAAMIVQQSLQPFGEMGIRGAAVYSQKEPDEVLPVALIMKCCFSVFLAVVIFLMAPLWADFFGRPELTSATRFTALFVVIGTLTFPSIVKAEIGLRFKELSLPNLWATAIG